MIDPLGHTVHYDPGDPPPTWDEYIESMDEHELLVNILRCLSEIRDLLARDNRA